MKKKSNKVHEKYLNKNEKFLKGNIINPYIIFCRRRILLLAFINDDELNFLRSKRKIYLHTWSC